MRLSNKTVKLIKELHSFCTRLEILTDEFSDLETFHADVAIYHLVGLYLLLGERNKYKETPNVFR